MPSNHLETNNRRDAFKCMCVSMLAASCVFTCSRVVVVVCMSHLHVWLSQIPGMRWHEGYYHGDTRMWVGRKERQRDEQTLNMITMIRLQTTMTMHCRSDDIWCCDSSHQCVVGDDAEYLHSGRIMYHNNSIQHCSCYCLPWQQLGQSGHWLHQAVLQLRQLPAAEVSPSSSSVLAGAGGVTGLARTVHSLVQSVSVQWLYSVSALPGEQSLISLVWSITNTGPVSTPSALQCSNSTCTTLCSVRARIACLAPTATSEIARKSSLLSVCRTRSEILRNISQNWTTTFCHKVKTISQDVTVSHRIASIWLSSHDQDWELK